MNFEVGTVICWDNFPSPKFGGSTKRRWFICLGFSGIFAQIAIVYLSTTTTTLEDFQKFGKRSSHNCFVFQTNQFQIFEQNCAIDFDERPYSLIQEKIDKDKANITIKGKLTEDTMRMIYNRFLRSGIISPRELLDIHDSYNAAGITGLKKPKPHLK